VRGHHYLVSIQELHDRVPMLDEDLARWRRHNESKLRWYPDTKIPTVKSIPNGYLKLCLSPGRGGRTTWSEGPRGPLERKLPSFFAEIERRADEDDRLAEERRHRAALLRAQEQERIERQLQAQREQQRVEQLRAEITAWELAARSRHYIAALRARLGELDPETGLRLGRWCEWLEAWAERSDPVRNPDLVAGVGDNDSAGS
jgi:hypothetical protein